MRSNPHFQPHCWSWSRKTTRKRSGLVLPVATQRSHSYGRYATATIAPVMASRAGAAAEQARGQIEEAGKARAGTKSDAANASPGAGWVGHTLEKIFCTLFAAPPRAIHLLLRLRVELAMPVVAQWQCNSCGTSWIWAEDWLEDHVTL